MNNVFTNKTIVRNSIMDPKTFQLQLVNSKKEHLCCIIPFSIQDYFDKIISENPIARERIDIKVQFVAEGKNGGEFVLDFSKDKDHGPYAKEGTIDDWNYYMRLPAHLIEKAVNNKLLWETLFLSCRWKANRKPDQWNEHLMNLFYDPDPKRIGNIYKIYDKMFK